MLLWYLNHSLDVTPINPSCSSIKFSSQSKRPPLATVASPSLLTAPSETALSVITPPVVTQKVLQEAKQVGVRAVWLQPGSYNDSILEEARKWWPDGAVADFEQDESGFGTRGGEGWCVLVDGEEGLKLAGQSSRL